MIDAGMVPAARRGRLAADAGGQHAGRAGRGPRRRGRLRLRADRELDRRIGDADAGQPGDRSAAADVRRADPGRGVQHRRQARPHGRRRRDGGRLSGGRGAGAAVAGRASARGRTAPGQLQRRRRAGGRRRPRRRRGELPAGRRRSGVWRRWPTASSTKPMRAPASCWSDRRPAAGPHRRRPDLGGAADRQRAERAGDGARRVRDPRHRPDPDRIPAHPNRIGHLLVLPGLRRPHRRRCGRRGTQGAAPALYRRAISGFLADGRRSPARRRRGRRGGALAGGVRDGSAEGSAQ